jgi:hypothetical protein
MAADDIDWAWQELHLRLRLQEIHGEAFEALFQEIGKALLGNRVPCNHSNGPPGRSEV